MLLRLAKTDKNTEKGQRVAQALGYLAQGDVQVVEELAKLASTGDAAFRYSTCLSIRALVAASPDLAFEVALTSLREFSYSSKQRALFLEIIGLCAFLNVRAAIDAIREFAHSSETADRISSAALLGELLPVLQNASLPVLNTLADDEDWTIRESVARPLSRRALFVYDKVSDQLHRLMEDDEIAVALATAVATRLVGDLTILEESSRISRYLGNARRYRILNQWINQQRQRGQGGFTPFVLGQQQSLFRIIRELGRFGPELIRRDNETGPSTEADVVSRRRSLDFKELDSVFREIAQSSQESVTGRTALEKLLELLPDPLVFYLIYKAAPDEPSRAIRRLFYEIVSLVERAESTEILKTKRADLRLRRLIPDLLERLENGFRELEPSDFAKEYAAQFSSLRHLLTASSLSEIPIALAASGRELGSFKNDRGGRRNQKIRQAFDQINQAIEPLRQYGDDTPLSLRTVPLSETLSNLEGITRVISFESTEPYRTILLQILSNWRELLRSAIRRLEGEAKLVFTTIKVQHPRAIFKSSLWAKAWRM